MTAFLRRTIFALLLALPLFAQPPASQITISCGPQPMFATRAVGVKTMGLWKCWITNDGANAVTLTPAKFYQAVSTQLRPLSPEVAGQIVTDSIAGLPQSKFVKLGQVAVALAGAGLAIYTSKPIWALGAGLIATDGPRVIQIIEGQVPTGGPYVMGQFTSPVTIAPAGEIPAVTLYAMKTKDPKAFTVQLR